MSDEGATRGRTSFARATEGYDEAHERALLDAIVTAIFEASRVSDAQACVVRTGEVASALLSALALVLAVSPSAAHSPTAIRKTVDDLHKRLRRQVAAAGQDAGLQDFVRRFFWNTDAAGNA